MTKTRKLTWYAASNRSSVSNTNLRKTKVEKMKQNQEDHAPKHRARTRNWRGMMVAASYKRGVSNTDLRKTTFALYLREATGTILAEIQKRDVRRRFNMHVSPFIGRWDFCF